MKVKTNTMKITVKLLVFYAFALALVICDDSVQLENYDSNIQTYQIDVPGKEPITIIENVRDDVRPGQVEWKEMAFNVKKDKEDVEMKNMMTHIVHDLDGNRPRCYGPSCQDGFSNDEDGFDDYLLTADKLKDYGDFPQDRLQAISALAAKLKKDKIHTNGFPTVNSDMNDGDQNGKVYTTWNRLKVKQHKHPYDEKEGWVTLEPVAWSTSKISKWKPNVKKQKPNHWNDDDEDRFSNTDRFPSGDRFPSSDRFPNSDRFPSNDRFPSGDRFPTNDRFPIDDRFSTSQESGDSFSYSHKRPMHVRPGYTTNKLHGSSDFDSEIPSKPTWNNPQQASYPWAPDEGRRPHKPNCDSHDNYPNDDTVFYGMPDSVLTDNRPANFPYDYEALHQSSSTFQRRPFKKPTQVVYAGSPDYETDRVSRPSSSDGQWVLLSTTKGYRNKKRQRSLIPPQKADDRTDSPTMTSHQAVALTVLPVNKAHTNMTISHGGLLEVEKSFKTVEESKREMDKRHDLDVAATAHFRPLLTKNKVIKRKVVTSVTPDSSTVLAAVGAGMVPATMAMVLPMMLGKRRRREISRTANVLEFDNLLYKYRR